MNKHSWQATIGVLSGEFFRMTLLTYFVFLVVEEFERGFVSYYVNLNGLLVIVILSGLAAFFTNRSVPDAAIPNTVRRLRAIVTTTTLSVLVAIAVVAVMRDFGNVSVVLGALAAICVILLALVTASDRRETTEHGST